MKYFFAGVFLFQSIFTLAQSVNAPLNEDYYHWIDRYEIKAGQLSQDFHSSWRAYQRESIASFMSKVGALNDLSSVDSYNVSYLLNDNYLENDEDEDGD